MAAIRVAAFGFWVLTLLWAPPAAARTSFGPNELSVVASTQLSPRLSELAFTTPALDGPTRVRVLLPSEYRLRPKRRYPVLYLLHGGFGSYRDWTERGAAEEITAGERLIVVMPDTGSGNGYTDWHNGGRGGPPMWETYHLAQLVPWIDRRYRTVADRRGRAIAGASMGGGGAMTYAARHPDMFGLAASFSGALNTNRPAVQLLHSAYLVLVAQPDATYGSRLTDEVRWRGHNAWDLAPNLRGVRLTLRTANGLPGNGELGDPVEAEVHRESIDMHSRLTDLGIPHTWEDRGPGGHTWTSWQRYLTQLMPELRDAFANPTPPPQQVTHRSIDPAFRVHGWRVRMSRTVVEFAELRDASRAGFALSGSGAARVVTPPLYRPGRLATATIRRGTKSMRRSVMVRSDCRLRVDVELGPENSYQQYTPEAAVHGHETYVSSVAVEGGGRCPRA